MDLTAFRGTGALISISATTASTANTVNSSGNSVAGMTLRAVNNAATLGFVSFSTSTSPDATSDANRLPVLGGTERIFEWPPTAVAAAVALSSGTGTFYLQLGKGF